MTPAQAARQIAPLVIPPEKVLHALSGSPLTNKEVRDMLGYPAGSLGPMVRDQDVGKVFTALLALLKREGKVETIRVGNVSKYRLTALGQSALATYLAAPQS